jgi:hypothetical protein
VRQSKKGFGIRRNNYSKKQLNTLEEKTYYRYRSITCAALMSRDVAIHLQSRYNCQALSILSSLLPVTIIWENTSELVAPDRILGFLDNSKPTPFTSSTSLSERDYSQARRFIKQRYEEPPSEVQYEGCDYRMTSIDLSGNIPKINGAFGLYYDNILTQYALEWELKKYLLRHPTNIITMSDPGTLPLRESIENKCNPLFKGDGRCAAMTISTLIVFQRANRGFYTIIRRRSKAVGVSPGLHHIAPAGMFEAPNIQDAWSIEESIWRELLEEVYNEKEQLGSGISEYKDYIRSKKPIQLLLNMIDEGRAELSVTGICCDLLNLRHEICTILFVPDPIFIEARRMELNWEYEKESSTGIFGIEWNRIPEFAQLTANTGSIVVSGAACLELGRKWLASRHKV